MCWILDSTEDAWLKMIVKSFMGTANSLDSCKQQSTPQALPPFSFTISTALCFISEDIACQNGGKSEYLSIEANPHTSYESSLSSH
jgi:hypothetical protein